MIQLISLLSERPTHTGDYFSAFCKVSIMWFSNRSCIVCGVTDDSPMEVLSDNQRTMIFILRGNLVSSGSRCCSDHLYRGQLYREDLWQMADSISERLSFGSADIQDLIEKLRSSIQVLGGFNFDDPTCLSDECCFNMTGFEKGNSFNWCWT